MFGAIYVENSKNGKLGNNVSTTYASIDKSCPSTCELKDKTCYGKFAYTGIINSRLNKEAKKLSPLQVARAEAKAIDSAYNGGQVPKGQMLRIHTIGDSKSRKGTRLINNAVKRWKERGGSDCWGYSHAWKNVPRQDWNAVSILASVSNVKEAEEARMRGWAPAIVVGEHVSDKVYTLPGSNIKWIPCVQQTRGITCSDCKLCFNTDRLHKSNMGIAFAAHGIMRNQMKRFLPVVK